MTIVFMMTGLLLVGCGSNTSLTCKGGTFSEFRLNNTMARRYEDNLSGSICTLSEQSEGVIWIATGEGHALKDAGEILKFTDDQGRQFEPVCWTKSGTIGGVTQTEIFLAGPADSKAITVCYEDTCMDAQLKYGF